MQLTRPACSFALLLLFVPPVEEASAQVERPVQWMLEPAAAAVGGADIAGPDSVVFRLAARIDEGWNLYAPTQPAAGPYPMEVGVAAGWRMVGDLVAPRPRRLPDRNFGIISEVYRGPQEFLLAVRPDGGEGSSLEVLVRYQACTRTYCLPPRTDTLRWAVAGAGDASEPVARAAEPAPAAPVAAANPAAAAASGTAAEAAAIPNVGDAADVAAAAAAAPTWAVFGQPFAAGPPDGAGSKLTFLWLALAMGLLSLLTPCVFPMIPLTVSYFGGDRSGLGPGGDATEGGGRRRRAARLRDATLFGAGIVVTFTVVGFAVAVLFGAGSVLRLAASPWMNLAIAALFLVFALTLLGVLELRLPTRLLSSASRLGSAGSATGATLMG
ncbi:MAG: cytochrome c biogenesis protein CcdA, partial [Gemmatimonadales bacterium]